MFEKVIVATDLSAAANAVVRNLSGLQAFGTVKCLLMECLSLPQAGSIGLYYTYNVLEKNLRDQREILEKQGFEVETRIVPGLAKSEIAHVAEEEDYSLIVVGALTSSRLNEFVFGGIAYDITHHCRKPILVVRLAEGKSEGEHVIRPVRSNYSQHILLPTDFSEIADQAFRAVIELASRGLKKVTVMHVQDKSRIEPHLIERLGEFNEIDDARLADMKEKLLAEGVREVDTVLAYGNPSQEILSAVRDRNVQLVIMGSQGRGYVKEMFLGSVSHNIARMSESSVLLIPAKPES